MSSQEVTSQNQISSPSWSFPQTALLHGRECIQIVLSAPGLKTLQACATFLATLLATLGLLLWGLGHYYGISELATTGIVIFSVQGSLCLISCCAGVCKILRARNNLEQAEVSF